MHRRSSNAYGPFASLLPSGDLHRLCLMENMDFSGVGYFAPGSAPLRDLGRASWAVYILGHPGAANYGTLPVSGGTLWGRPGNWRLS
jgi:hypothetical protein